MKNNDSWEQHLRQLMADAEAPVSDDLWADIERALPRQPRKARVVPLWSRWAAAAVIAVMTGAGIVGSWMARHQETQAVAEVGSSSFPDEHSPLAAPNSSLQTPHSSLLTPNSSLPTPNSSSSPAPRYAKQQTAADKPSGARSDETASAPVLTAENQPQSSDDAPSVDTPETPRRQHPADRRKDNGGIPAVRPSEYRTPTAGDKQRLTLSLMAQNTIGGGNSMTDPVMMSPGMVSHLTRSAAKSKDGYYLANADVTTDYSAPVAFGLGISYALNDRWKLHTGLDYMTTSTTMAQRIGASTVSSRNRLTYIGLPVRASMHIVALGSLRLYAIGGVEAYLNVENKRTTQGITDTDDHDNPQWAADLSAGAELQLWKPTAIYVEPGAKYYFDNKSSIDTYFKHHRFAPSLQFGLRCNF